MKRPNKKQIARDRWGITARLLGYSIGRMERSSSGRIGYTFYTLYDPKGMIMFSSIIPFTLSSPAVKHYVKRWIKNDS